jgi:hypothetical protein
MRQVGRGEVDALAASRALRMRVRRGEVSQLQLERAAWLGDAVAAAAVGDVVDAHDSRDWPRDSTRAYRDPRSRPEVDRLAVWLGQLETWGVEAQVRALLAVFGLWTRHEEASQERAALERARVAIAVWLAEPAQEQQLRDALRSLRIRWQTLGNGLRRWGERTVLYASGHDVTGQPLPARACPWTVRGAVRDALVPWLLGS